ncbi:hypothetical protein E2C01_074420 [Portunus trituberculatus]|uniref:Reverse transcriptase zinc-binding domain-containing protein n=1 Tax=Portunus trituberculatus TaxID=210409 RepID=A0A5B7IE90_PORTR|nr:hypothetical protein [Portunus trituberculatus]
MVWGFIRGGDECRYKIQTWEGAKATAAIACLYRGHTTFSAHLHHLHLSPDPFCPWCRTIPETIEHFLLHCSHFHSHRTALSS